MLTADLFFALTVFAFVSSITPGPNNIMLMASGVNFGVRRTLPHAAGVTCGFVVMVAAVGLGLGGLFQRYPAADTALRIAGSLYLIWLAWRIARTRAVGEGEVTARPMTFLEAAAFQWVNVKAWVMAVTATVAYAPPGGGAVAMLTIAFVFGLVNLPSVAVWAGFGAAMRRFLADPRRLSAFNLTMALLLLASLWPMVRPLFG